MAENKDKQNNTKKKEIGLFIAKTLFYFAVLVVLVYLYSYSAVSYTHLFILVFAYNLYFDRQMKKWEGQ